METAGRDRRSKDAAGRWAVRSPSAVCLFLAVSAAGLAADLSSKHFVFASMLGRGDMSLRVSRIRAMFLAQAGKEPTSREALHYFQRRICPGVQFTLSVNPGVVFGLPVPRPVVAVATLVTVVLVGFFFASADARARTVHLAMACILSGALGNLYDRLFSEVALPGLEPARRHVRDFIDCSELYYPWVFNVADVLLVVGVGLLVLHWFFTGRRQHKQAKAGRP